MGNNSKINNLKPSTIIKGFEQWCLEFKTPKTILSDQGRQYISTEFKEYTKGLGAKNIFSTPYNPTGNGIAERINSKITFAMCHFKHLGIQNCIELAQRKLRHSYNRSLKTIPSTLISNTDNKSQLDQAYKNLVKNSIQNMSKINKKRNTSIKYKKDDIVYAKSRENGKMAPKWIGPYRISNVQLGEQVVRLENNTRSFTINIKHIRPLGGGECGVSPLTNHDYHTNMSNTSIKCLFLINKQKDLNQDKH